MTRQETAKIMEILKAAYPRYYATAANADELRNAVALWADMFRDDNVSVVAAAVKSFIASDVKGFPPVIGQVKAKIRLLTERREESEMEAWQMVLNAVRVSGYDAKKEFAKFPPITKRIVGSPATLREWAMMDADKLHTVVASNFQRSYKAIASKEAEINALPADIRSIVKQIGQGTADRPKIEDRRIPEKKAEMDGSGEISERAPLPKETIKALKMAFCGEWEATDKQSRSKEDVIKYLKGK